MHTDTERMRKHIYVCVRVRERALEQSLSLWKMNLLQPAKICLGELLRQKVRHCLSQTRTRETLTNSCIETVMPFSYSHYFCIQLTCGVDGKVFGKDCVSCAHPSLLLARPSVFLICVLYQFSPDQPKKCVCLQVTLRFSIFSWNVQAQSSSHFISETQAMHQNGIKNRKRWDSSKMHYSELFPWGFL